jgi:hypothetical protein
MFLQRWNPEFLTFGRSMPPNDWDSQCAPSIELSKGINDITLVEQTLSRYYVRNHEETPFEKVVARKL